MFLLWSLLESSYSCGCIDGVLFGDRKTSLLRRPRRWSTQNAWWSSPNSSSLLAFMMVSSLSMWLVQGTCDWCLGFRASTLSSIMDIPRSTEKSSRSTIHSSIWTWSWPIARFGVCRSKRCGEFGDAHGVKQSLLRCCEFKSTATVLRLRFFLLVRSIFRIQHALNSKNDKTMQRRNWPNFEWNWKNSLRIRRVFQQFQKKANPMTRTMRRMIKWTSIKQK